ncbi:MAG: TraR/DksA C4-type zinc finger protein [Nitrospirota bacterium]|nr:TraR/DksA C4-type zinc finger protein [Nitrospirota bacterium]
MKKTERKKLEKKIAAEIKEVKGRIAVLEEAAKLLSNEGSVRRLSLRELIKAKSAGEGELRAAKVRCNKLERASKKIDDPDFGTCFFCERVIPFERLLEMPETTRCVNCEDK